MPEKPLSVLHLSTWDMKGGAARGAYWLHKGLQQAGIHSKMLVAEKQSDDASVLGADRHIPLFVNKFRQFMDNLPVQMQYPDRSHQFSPAWFPSAMPKQIEAIAPDIVHLHWVCAGLLTPEAIARIQQPIVWTLRDMWAFTGGCHYALDCKKYQKSCGACPDLDSPKERDLSRWVWQRKHKAWEKANFTIVAISEWLADCARNSSLFYNKRIEVIHNALDESIFKPVPKAVARQVFNLPRDRKIILFGAFNAIHNPVKGFDYLQQALQKLALTDLASTAMLVIFGSGTPQNPPNLGLPARYMGRIQDDYALAVLYSAADVMVVPSVQEAFGKTAMEALACGTPVVSFDATGLKSIVEHQKTGYRAKCFDVEDLANGITWVLQDELRWHQLSARSRQKVEEEFTLKKQAENYIRLYEESIKKSKL